LLLFSNHVSKGREEKKSEGCSLLFKETRKEKGKECSLLLSFRGIVAIKKGNSGLFAFKTEPGGRREERKKKGEKEGEPAG